jgi:FAD/FMN-containing dehydrogenase
LQRPDVGQVRFSSHDRQLYSTDASLYQVKPIGVVIPDNVDQIQGLVAYCNQNRIPIPPRGDGEINGVEYRLFSVEKSPLP